MDRSDRKYAKSYNKALHFAKKPFTGIGPMVDPATGQFTKPKRAKKTPDQQPRKLGPENKAFLKALDKSPFDHNTRNAYADYLREQDHHDMADFHQSLAHWLQHEYPSQRSDDPNRPWSIKHDPLAEYHGEQEPPVLPWGVDVTDLPGYLANWEHETPAQHHFIPQFDGGTLHWPSAQGMISSLGMAHKIATRRRNSPPETGLDQWL
ncbi:TIGR02996 domain-containing protein [Gemmata sp. JC673]|uniref:TIGR02996 domain-containing protein n=1 Tax=Gemmata algarum TaxID=2975278 RepID=A0ABU5ET12_9BACT|nr:TIGR02996 domain-containing protein [Gemmata algarum]MDY3557612.1 TIGR02996 domain-containing protein [Gemmata algarum]